MLTAAPNTTGANKDNYEKLHVWFLFLLVLLRRLSACTNVG
jgi:hypothetical protein